MHMAYLSIKQAMQQVWCCQLLHFTTSCSTAMTCCGGCSVQADGGKRQRQELGLLAAPAMSSGVSAHRFGDSATAATAWRAALNPLLEPTFGGSGMSGSMLHSIAPASAPTAPQVTSLLPASSNRRRCLCMMGLLAS